jgi:hypothetical protein
MAATNGTSRSWLGGLVDEAGRYLTERIDHLAETARQETGRLAEHAAERFARNLVEQISRRLATRLAWAAATAGAMVIAVWLMAVGLAGALGELLGRAWIGQLAAGAVLLLSTPAWPSRRTDRRTSSPRRAPPASRYASSLTSPPTDL